jgi:two-component system alkaline phosphatase synthesis response regulator PhoP
MGSPREPRRILVADDEPQIGNLIRQALDPDGHPVDCVGDGQTALDRLKPGRYALLILDVLMPRLTGVEVVHELRRRGDAVPVLLMSSLSSEDVLAACGELPRLACLQKPFGLAELREAVRRSLAPVEC